MNLTVDSQPGRLSKITILKFNAIQQQHSGHSFSLFFFSVLDMEKMASFANGTNTRKFITIPNIYHENVLFSHYVGIINL